MFERLQQGKAEDVEDSRVVLPMIIRYTDSAFIVVDVPRVSVVSKNSLKPYGPSVRLRCG